MVRLLGLHWSHTQWMQVALVAICILLPAQLAPAQDGWHEAGVIVDYGDGRTTWVWVPYEDPDTSALDLLHRSELELVTVGFGGLGEGVCQIADTGCPPGECRTRMCQTSSSSPFWRFMRLDGDEWVFLSSGVSGTTVRDGDVFALSWSATTPELPFVGIDELAANAGADRDAANPVSAMRTDGDAPDEHTSAWAPAAGALGLVVVAAGVLVLRARASRQAAA